MLAQSKAFSGFAVDDLEQAREFYGDTLGLEVELIDDPGLLNIQLAGDRATLVYPKPDFEPATYTILNFPVDEVEATVDELTSRGVSFERYEGMEQDEKGISRAAGGPEIAWFRDPAGNILAVLEKTEG
jgi:catechol 2,3-dioxygenase-like lactoylglutathione lyase family enzyme